MQKSCRNQLSFGALYKWFSSGPGRTTTHSEAFKCIHVRDCIVFSKSVVRTPRQIALAGRRAWIGDASGREGSGGTAPAQSAGIAARRDIADLCENNLAGTVALCCPEAVAQVRGQLEG